MPKSLARFSEPFLVYIRDIRGASPLTVKTYRIALKQLFDYARIETDGKTIIHLMPLRQHIAKQHKKTIAKKLSAIRSFVTYLKEREGIECLLKDDTPIKVAKTLPKPIEHRYIVEALALANQTERLLVLMLYLLGLRISELANLELGAIKERWIRIMGKGQKVRDVPLPKQLAALMETYQKQTQPKQFFFENSEQKLSEDSLRYILMKTFKRIGIKATPHQLRHSYATGLLNGGARIEEVSELLGHESIATTQIYTKLASNLKMENYLASHPLGKFKEH